MSSTPSTTMSTTTPDAADVLRDILKMLRTKTKIELWGMANNPETPIMIVWAIMTYPEFLGNTKIEEKPSTEAKPFVTTTEKIIKAHGFSHTYEWEYECEKESREPVCLRIWIGRKGRTKKNLRVLTLTEEQKREITPLLVAEF